MVTSASVMPRSIGIEFKFGGEPCTGRLGEWDCPWPIWENAPGRYTCNTHKFRQPYTVAYHWIHIPVENGENCADHNYWKEGAGWLPCAARTKYDDGSNGDCVEGWHIF